MSEVSNETLSPHDSEEQLRPFLGRVFDAEEAFLAPTGGMAELLHLRDTQHEALERALELLDVPPMTTTKETR